STALIAVQASHVCSTSNDTDGGAVFVLPTSGGVTPRELARGKAVTGLAIDDANVYWADGSRGTVEFVPLTGGPNKALATGQQDPGAIAVDSSHVYWVNAGGSIMRMRKP